MPSAGTCESYRQSCSGQKSPAHPSPERSVLKGPVFAVRCVGRRQLISHTALSQRRLFQWQNLMETNSVQGSIMGLFSYLWTEYFPPKDANDSLKDRPIKTPSLKGRNGGSPSPPLAEPSHPLHIFPLQSLPSEHSLKYLDKNQCFNKGRLIVPNSPLAEIITLNKYLLSVRGR